MPRTWLNLAPDHLDWHGSLDTYAAAKARIWEHQRPDDVAIGYADDPVVMAWLAKAPGRQLTFARGRGPTTASTAAGWSGPRVVLAEVADLRRRLPHDITNALAAAATVLEGGRRDARRASPRRWRRSRGSPTASRSWPKLAGCRSTTTPRRRRPTPP